MKVNKKYASLIRLPMRDDPFVDASPEELLSFMWELTAELWSLKGPGYVERRLQRNIAVLIKK